MSNYAQLDAPDSIGTLRQAIPYLRLFQGKTFVIKFGGALFDDAESLRTFFEQVAVLHQLKVHIVLVHGGGPQTTKAAGDLGLESQFCGGRRITTPEILRVATRVMNGELSTQSVALLRDIGVPAVGLSGVDGGLVVAQQRPPQSVGGSLVDYGEVGDIIKTDPSILSALTAADFLPVVSPLSADAKGRILNINADTVAARIACDLGAEKLIFATGAAGILDDPATPSSLHSFLDLAELSALEQNGVIHTGMQPKALAARRAIDHGVPRVHIISAQSPDSLLTEVFTNEGSGTLIVKEKKHDD